MGGSKRTTDDYAKKGSFYVKADWTKNLDNFHKSWYICPAIRERVKPSLSRFFELPNFFIKFYI